MFDNGSQAIKMAMVTLWSRFINFIPNFLSALIVFLVGWFLALVLEKVIIKVLQFLKVDLVLEKTDIRETWLKAGVDLSISKFIGALVKWFLIIAFLMASTNILKLDQVTNFLNDVLLYIPNIVVAVVILLVAVILAGFFQKVVKASVESAGLASGDFLGALTKWSILLFGLLAALVQLKFKVSDTILSGIVGMLALGGGLAFGLGGRTLAEEILEKIRRDIFPNRK
jgi:hypothetical protein